ncbi:MAG: hypothetical protein OEY58_19375 [Gammaproteobacteria bacterium]|nr:hypothetical protein [Gammaproteobacteria bacterium]
MENSMPYPQGFARVVIALILLSITGTLLALVRGTWLVFSHDSYFAFCSVLVSLAIYGAEWAFFYCFLFPSVQIPRFVFASIVILSWLSLTPFVVFALGRGLLAGELVLVSALALAVRFVPYMLFVCIVSLRKEYGLAVNFFYRGIG